MQAIPALLGGLVLILAGCQTAKDYSLTYKLWDDEAFRHFNEPTSNPNLILYVDQRRGDVLIQYDEVSDPDGNVRRRAFYLNPNFDRLKAGRKPRFVDPEVALGLLSIPVVRPDIGESIPAAGLCVTASENLRALTLYSEGKVLESWSLPTYAASTGAMRKTLLTPLAITGDTLRAAFVVGLVGAYAWVESGAYWR